MLYSKIHRADGRKHRAPGGLFRSISGVLTALRNRNSEPSTSFTTASFEALFRACRRTSGHT